MTDKCYWNPDPKCSCALGCGLSFDTVEELKKHNLIYHSVWKDCKSWFFVIFNINTFTFWAG